MSMQSLNTKIEQISNDLYLITLTPLIRGFDNFISVWLHKGEKTFIIDVGPSVTSADLITALRGLKVDHLDYIFLTHIHLDHAGGIGEISSCYPETPIICHQAGIDHLVDPNLLIEGTIKALGDTGRAYGLIQPVLKDQLMDAGQFVSDGIVPVITPGHSQHHVSYLTEEYLFVGEAAGVCFPLASGTGDFMRPATPPRFFLDITIKSIDDLIARKPKKICFSHFGIKDDSVKMLKAHKDQLLLWEKLISEQMKRSREEDFLNTCMDVLLKSDPRMAGFSCLDESVQERERTFIYNSIKGFHGYLKTVSNNS